MFSALEESYIKSLINTYKKEGYSYYVVHTVNETDNEYDFYIYFSKDEIVFSDSYTFELSDNSLMLKVDSSSRNDNSYNSSTGHRDLVFYESGTISVNIAEFIYTNANYNHSLIVHSLNPDIMNSGLDSYNNNLISLSLLFICSSIFMFMFVKSLLRLRR